MWLTIKTLEHDKVVTAKLKNTLPDEVMEQIEKQTKGSETAIAAGECKFRWIDSILSGAVTETKTKAALGRLDRIYTHKFWGKPAVVLTVLIGLIGAFIPALPIMGIGSGVDALNGIEDIEKPPSE